METFKINTEFITLGQFLKALGYIDSGGAAKHYLRENDCFVNEVKTTERGKKLYPKDQLRLHDQTYVII